MYLILSGRCESRHVDPSRHLVTAIHGPGDTLGDREVMQREPYLSTVTVVTKACCCASRRRTCARSWNRAKGRRAALAIDHPAGHRAAAPHCSGRIVALHALSGRINERLLGRRLADVLGEVTAGAC